MSVSPARGHYGSVRVLVVEDQKVLADRIAEGLRDQGMAVDVAYDGEAAMEVTAFTGYDVIVLDRALPRGRRGRPGGRGSPWTPMPTWASRSPSPNWSRGSARWPGAARPRHRWRS